MEQQLEKLTELMAKQADMAITAQREAMAAREEARQEAQVREQRFTDLLERLTPLAAQRQTTTVRGGSQGIEGSEGTSEGEDAGVRSPAHPPKLPHSATPTPYLSSSASLKEFDAWREKFEGYVSLTGVSARPIKEQRAVLLSALDVDWSRTLRYILALPASTDLDTILDAMEAHLRRQRNIIVDRRDFNRRVQEQGESFDDFLCGLKEIAAFCDFCKVCMDDRLRDKIVEGVSDGEAMRCMMEDMDLNLKKAIAVCRAAESAGASSAAMRGPGQHTLAKVSQYKRDNRDLRSRSPKSEQCFRCGKERHADSRTCKAIGQVCNSCGKSGHFSVMCKSASAPQAAPRVQSPRPRKPVKRGPRHKPGVHQLITNVHVGRVSARPTPQVRVSTTYPGGCGTPLWTPDSGAETTVMGLGVAKSLGIRTSSLDPAGGMSLYGAGRQWLTCLGTFTSRLGLGDKETTVKVSVIKEVRGGSAQLV